MTRIEKAPKNQVSQDVMEQFEKLSSLYAALLMGPAWNICVGAARDEWEEGLGKERRDRNDGAIWKTLRIVHLAVHESFVGIMWRDCLTAYCREV